jgi:DNA-binding GntR family transcriptional regulator
MPRPIPVTKLLRDEIYDRIKQAILACDMPPGFGIREQTLAKHFGVSKSPVRDALHRLQSEGLVEVKPRKGYHVTTVSLEDALELYEMRLILECACVERAARAASHSDLSLLARYKRGPKTDAQREWITYNREFHIAIAGMCGNQRLASAARDVVSAFDRLTSASLTQLEGATGRSFATFEAMDREHSEIIEALRKRDANRAVQLMQLHIETSRNRYLRSYRPDARNGNTATLVRLHDGRKRRLETSNQTSTRGPAGQRRGAE